MLVLSRKTGQRIVLPENNIRVTVLGIHGKRVRLGIEAPAGASVHRDEVWKRILDLAGPSYASANTERPDFECSPEEPTT